MIILYGKDENKLVSKYNTTIKETNVEYGISNAIDTEPTEYSLIVPKVRMKLFNRNKNYFLWSRTKVLLSDGSYHYLNTTLLKQYFDYEIYLFDKIKCKLMKYKKLYKGVLHGKDK